MRFTAFLLLPLALLAQPRVDNVLTRMVPSGVTSLVGVRMDLVQQSPFYVQLIGQQKLPQIEEFAKETGFDPRRDVREVLYAGVPTGSVVLARGTFKVKQTAGKIVRHGVYNIHLVSDDAGFCILDSTLAAAGDLKSIEAALNEWKSGGHTAAKPLLDRVRAADPATQFWGVSTGAASFVADHMPRAGQGLDFSKMFNGLEDTWFQVSLSNGFKGEVHGTAANSEDANRLRDAAKGLVGYGRLSVPENQTEMLRFWDGLTAETQGRALTIHADIPTSLMNQMVKMLSGAPKN